MKYGSYIEYELECFIRSSAILRLDTNEYIEMPWKPFKEIAISVKVLDN